MPPVVQDALICLGLFLLVVFVFRGYIIEGKINVAPDMVSQGAPFDRFAREFTETYHTTPLWYPYIFSGMPFQASGTYHNPQFTYEGLLVELLPSFIYESLNGRATFHLLLGAISMFFLARALALSRTAGFIASVAFMLNGHVIGTEHINRLACFMHIPLVFFAAFRLFERRRPFYAVLLGGAFGSQLGSYHPQIAYYTALMLGLYAVYTVVADLRGKKEGKAILLSLGMFAGAVALAVGMAAVMVLPMQEYVAYSARSLSVGGSEVNAPFATSWSFPPIEMLTFVIPSFAGFGGQTYWGAMPFTDFPNYLGVTVVLLAVFALILRRNRMTLFLALLAICALLVAFGRHLPPVSYVMLHYAPFFAKFRAPVMILILVQFACALLAGYGVQALMDLQNRRRKDAPEPMRIVKPLGIAAGALFMLVLVLTWSGASFQSFMSDIYNQADIEGGRATIVSNPDIQTQINGIRFSMFFDDLWTMMLFFCATAVLIMLFLSRKIGRALFSAGLGALVAVDLLLVATKLVDPQYERGRIESYYEARNNKIIETLKQDDGLYRILPVDNVSSNEYGYFGISSVGGYHAAKLGIYEEFLNHVGFNSFAVLNMLNTKYLISRQPLSGSLLAPVVEADGERLYRNVQALPRAFLVDSVRVVTDKTRIFQEMKSPAFNPAKYAILETPISTPLGPVDASSVEITRYTPHRIDLTTDTTAPCLLVLSETYYPAGWTATIDGAPAEIYKTNYILRSVVVPAGRHEIRFVFEPRSFTLGLLLSRLSSAVVALVLGGAGIRRIVQALR